MIKGVVQKIIKNEQYGLTSFTLKGQDGFFSLGDKPATFQQGDSIQFETSVKGKYTYAQDISPWVDGGGTQSPPVASVANAPSNGWKYKGGFQRGGSGSSQEKDEYWKRKEQRDIEKEGDYALTQKRIEVQAARNAAIETAKFMWEKELTPALPSKIKQQEKYDTFLALVNQLTDTYLGNTKDRLTGIEGGQVPLEAGEAAQPNAEEIAGSGGWDD